MDADNHSTIRRTLRTPDEIDADEAMNVALFPAISTAVQNFLDIADGLYLALATGGIAADLSCNAKGCYEAGQRAMQSDNPYARRVAYLNLLQAFHEQPEAVVQAIGRLHEQLTACASLEPTIPDEVKECTAANEAAKLWPDFVEIADQVLKDAQERMMETTLASPSSLDMVCISPQIARNVERLEQSPITVWIDSELYIGGSRDHLHRVHSTTHDRSGRIWAFTADHVLWVLDVADIPSSQAA